MKTQNLQTALMHSAAKILAHIVWGTGIVSTSKKRKASSGEDEQREEEEEDDSGSDAEEEEDSNWAEQFNPLQNKSDRSTYNKALLLLAKVHFGEDGCEKPKKNVSPVSANVVLALCYCVHIEYRSSFLHGCTMQAPLYGINQV